MRGMMRPKLKLTGERDEDAIVATSRTTRLTSWGYTLGRNYDCRTGESYLGPRPSRRKENRPALPGDWRHDDAKDGWGETSGRRWGRINRKLKGWSNYFRLGTGSEQSLPKRQQSRPPSGAASG